MKLKQLFNYKKMTFKKENYFRNHAMKEYKIKK